MTVKQLSETVINQIAAGEVIERPASVVKELVDNAIDAGADRIDVVTAAGGKTLLRITDNGCGMSAEDLVLAVQRHCTSKLNEDDLFDIRTLGFRGEALPSIGAVSRLSIATRREGESNGWQCAIDGGNKSECTPTAINRGTRVEVRDLFFATPARLKFLKSDRAETNAITDVLKRLALAYPAIHFTIDGTDRKLTEYAPARGDNPQLVRIGQVLGADFIENAMTIDAVREGVRVSGFAGLPTFHRANALQQFFFVNGRPVKDKLLLGAMRGAYADVLARDRHPIVVLFIDVEPHDVDVNVHPAKSDVRFRDAAHVRGLLVSAIKQALAAAGHRASTAGGWDTLAAIRPQGGGNSMPPMTRGWRGGHAGRYAYTPQRATGGSHTQSVFRPLAPDADINGITRVADHGESGFGDGSTTYTGTTYDGMEEAGGLYRNDEAGAGQASMHPIARPSADTRAHDIPADETSLERPLGAPRAQIHANYIVSQTKDGLVIVDQHAAHERLVYERLKEALEKKGVQRQLLLIPEVVELPEEDVSRLLERCEDLAEFGLVIEAFGPGAVAVRETPALLGDLDIRGLVKDIADDLAEWNTATRLEEKLNYVAATMACHGSVRSGRHLRAQEMDALLREMEATPLSGQCNHGRPTYVELKLKDIERLFGRR
ncbi:MAG: DNA mismatch repair endonuclease MutL [Stappiaceae bacterium]